MKMGISDHRTSQFRDRVVLKCWCWIEGKHSASMDVISGLPS